MLFCAPQDITLKGCEEVQLHNKDQAANLGDNDDSDDVRVSPSSPGLNPSPDTRSKSLVHALDLEEPASSTYRSRRSVSSKDLPKIQG
ncbi:hypothetical protein J6590_076049 [Homalodisca vitripennis]|nr:hypothetical protein J6590_076049 [Homalodisca vitripennis]